MNHTRFSRMLSSAGAWLLLVGSVGLLLSLNSLDGWMGWAFALLSLVALLVDPIAFFVAPAPSFRSAAAYYRPRLLAAWATFALASVLFIVRSFLSLPLDKTGAVEDTPIGRLRSVLLALFLIGLFGGFLYRLWLGLEAASEDTVRDPGIRSRFGSLAALQVIGLVALLAGLNVLSAYRNASLDLSPGLYSYSEPARAIIKAIDRPVRIIAFLPVQQVIRDTGRRTTPPELTTISEELRVMIDQLKLINPKLSVDIVNADLVDPGNEEYRGITNGTILIRSYSDEASTTTPFAERRVYVYGEKDLDRFEKSLIEALVHVSLPPSKIYFARSNGELGPSAGRPAPDGLDEWITALRFYNFTITQTDSGPTITIPDDAKALVLAGPTVPYSKESRDAILAYLRKGGSVLALANPTGKEDFSWLLEGVGSQYRLQSGFLSMFRDHPGLLHTGSFSDHKMVQSLKSVLRGAVLLSGQGFFEKRKPTEPAATQPEGTKTAYKEDLLLHSDGRAFRDRNRNGRIEPGEEAGRFVLGLLFEDTTERPSEGSTAPMPDESQRDASLTAQSGKLIVLSDANMLSNAMLAFPVDKENVRFGLDSMLWLVGGSEIPGIVVKERTDRAIQVNDDLKLRNIVLGVFGFPVASGLLLALSLYLYRRRRKFGEQNR